MTDPVKVVKFRGDFASWLGRGKSLDEAFGLLMERNPVDDAGEIMMAYVERLEAPS